MRVGEESYYFGWSGHHILLDGWCQQIVMGEVFSYYESARKGEELKLKRPRAYREYIAWLRKQDETKAEEFWREELKGFREPTRLGIEREGRSPEGGKQEYGEVRRQLGLDLTSKLEELCRREQVTLNTLVQGAWGLLLSRYSGEEEVVFGATVSGRSGGIAEIEEMVGLFINTLPVRGRVRGEESVRSYLKRLQSRQAEARQYEYSPLLKVQGWSEAARDAPLFESIVVFENYPVDAILYERANMALQISQSQAFEITHYPLTLTVFPDAELTVKCPYNRQWFTEQSIVRALEHLKIILQEMAAGADRQLDEISLLTEAERQSVMAG
jgi:hypothetical protein